ncbi:hypothetical protein PsorP6_015236 [Peronosclerospora sorghi]|uniref:Uncharacterized protein n=1 Tax=Peronosclerospora sorghi TaxID=230839 RepID=A0ACC0VRL3_9STRA|nr:hypothetical protein PsorP6_015236 [Peronosclerospora sorghi]
MSTIHHDFDGAQLGCFCWTYAQTGIHQTLNVPHNAGTISHNADKSFSPFSSDTDEERYIYVENILTSVPLKHRNRYKMKIEDRYLPTETNSDVKVRHALMSRHIESNREGPYIGRHQHLCNLLQAQRTNETSVSTHRGLVDAADRCESRLFFRSSNDGNYLSKGDTNSEIRNSQVELNRIGNL